MKNRNLFAELNLTDDSFSKQQLLNNWTRPPPMEFHLLHSPALNQQLSSMTPQPNRSSSLPKYNLPPKTPSRGRKKERAKYHRWEQELQFLEDFLIQFKQLRQSELLAYRQKLLLNYLSGFVDQLKIECQEKAHFMSSVWNALVRIFEQVFDRVVAESKKVQKKLLNEEIKLHTDYQLKLEQLTQNNYHFKSEEVKSEKIMKQLIESIASLNVQLKGTKNLHEKTVTTLRELVMKYEFLRTEHMELLMSGSSGMSRKEAEAQMRDCQTLSLARQAMKEKVKVKPKQKSKAIRNINNNLDVAYLLEQLQAEEEYSFEIANQQQAETAKTYVNEKIQTVQLQQKVLMQKGTQCGYYQRNSLAMIQSKHSQTNLLESKMFFDQLTQTESINFQDSFKFCISSAFQIILHRYSKNQTGVSTDQALSKQQLCTLPSQQQPTEVMVNKDQNRPFFSRKSIQLKLQQAVASAEENKKGRLRQSKMFRVGDTRNSKKYNERILKTEGERQSSVSPLSKTSTGKRVSQIILVQKLRQDIVKNFSRFRNSVCSNDEPAITDFFQWIKQTLPKKFTGNNLQAQMIAAESNFAEVHTNNRLSLNSLRNVQLSQANAQLIQKIGDQATGAKKKLGAGKCLRLVADVLQMGLKLTDEGVISLNMATFTADYLAAIQGKCLSAEQKQKKFVQFIKACAPLTTSSYLVKNFFLLCGFPLSKLYRRSVTLKQKDDIRTEKVMSKYMYTSQVYVYFKLLQKANCNQGDNLLEAYTRGEKLYSILDVLAGFYKGNRALVQQAKNVVRMSIEQSEQKDPKLDIFKSLHMIIDQILQSKFRLTQQFEPLTLLYGMPDRQFAVQLIPLLTNNLAAIPIILRLFRIAYCQSYTPENMATLAVIEGLQLSVHNLSIIEQDNKFTILKKLMHVQSGQNKLLMNMIKAIPKKQLKKPEFLLLLKMLWLKQCDILVEQMLGNDLMTLHCIGLSHSIARPNSESYHSAIFRTQL